MKVRVFLLIPFFRFVHFFLISFFICKLTLKVICPTHKVKKYIIPCHDKLEFPEAPFYCPCCQEKVRMTDGLVGLTANNWYVHILVIICQLLLVVISLTVDQLFHLSEYNILIDYYYFSKINRTHEVIYKKWKIIRSLSLLTIGQGYN